MDYIQKKKEFAELMYSYQSMVDQTGLSEEQQDELWSWIESTISQTKQELIEEILKAGYDKETKTYSPDNIFEYVSKLLENHK